MPVPNSFSVGQRIRSADINENFDGLVDGTAFSDEAITYPKLEQAPRVFLTTTQNLSNTTDTIILYGSETYDTDNIHDTASNTNRVTPAEKGVYLHILEASFPYNAAGEREVNISRSDAGTIASKSTSPAVSTNARDHFILISCVDVVSSADITAGLYWQSTGRQGSGGTLNNCGFKWVVVKIANN